MVLELKVPHSPDFRALLPLWPVFMSYVLSFIYVGIYWNKHQYRYHPFFSNLRTALMSSVCLLLLSGCSTVVSDDSKQPVFAPYIGKSLALQRSQRLCEMPDDHKVYAVRRVKLASLTEYCPKQLIALPRGTVITIDGVSKRWMPVSGAFWYALGHVAGTNYDFEYPWAYIYTVRAPWEPDTVPEKRPPPG
ncbi:TMEM175 family protein [Massilia sp. Bi118]|uniref:TMEM175 family protein n=1 Tax=Massilia sp. Bi118 TaxID=2822346 RepID=UPI001E5C3155|nr:TMEM175 family protein [Massilia sp. Bi118]